MTTRVHDQIHMINKTQTRVQRETTRHDDAKQSFRAQVTRVREEPMIMKGASKPEGEAAMRGTRQDREEGYNWGVRVAWGWKLRA